MGKIRFLLRIYRMLLSQYIKTLMQYRADFFLSTLGLMLSNLTGLFTFGIIFTSIKDINGWNYYQLVFLYSFTMLAITPQELFFNNVWDLGYYVREGGFIKYYFRPLNIMFYYMSEFFDFKTLGRLLIGLVAFFYSVPNIGVSWSLSNVLLLIVTLFSASLIIISIMLITSASAFWLTNPFSLLMLSFKIVNFSYYPISIFNNVFRFLFTFIIPIAFIAFYPAQLLINPGNFNILVYISPVIGIVMFILAYKLWIKGTRVYSGTGS